MSSAAAPEPDRSPLVTNPAQLPVLLQQLVADLADPTIGYLLGGHYYERTNHPRARHFPAVFALRQGEVWNVEIGSDYLAFDTEFLRYPEQGEPHYPGPWADRFRVTVPFAQLYRLCRKVLPPAEQPAAAVSYGSETVLYYNALVQKQPPTPADMNQAYPVVPPAGEHPLRAVLTAVAASLADPTTHHLLHTTSFDGPAGPVRLGMLHLHAHTTRNLVVEAEAFTCSVLLDPDDRRQWSRVRVAYAQVWQVLRSDGPEMDLEEVEQAGGLLYQAPEVLSAYVRHMRPA